MTDRYNSFCYLFTHNNIYSTLKIVRIATISHAFGMVSLLFVLSSSTGTIHLSRFPVCVYKASAHAVNL